MKPDLPGDDGDFLVSGREAGRWRDRLSPRWRRHTAVAAVFLIGLLVGGYTGYIWASSSDEHEQVPPVSAEIRGLHALNLPYPPYRLAVDLRNDGAEPVTVEDTTLEFPGFDVFISPDQPQEIGPGQSVTIHYGVRPKCESADPGRTGSVHLRLRRQSGESRVTTVRARVRGNGISAGYAIVCSKPPPEIAVQAETLKVRHGADGGMRMWLEFSRATSVPPAQPTETRLLKASVDGAGLHDRGLTVRGLPALPATVMLELSVDNCQAAKHALTDPTILRVALITAGTPHSLYAHPDARFTDLVRRQVTTRCG